MKLLIAGDSGTGKSAFVSRWTTGSFGTSDKSDNSQIWFGTHIFDVTECSDMATPLQQGMYDAALIFFTYSSKASYLGMQKWYTHIRETHPLIPIILCANKCDIAPRNFRPTHIKFHHANKLKVYIMSCKSTQNYEKPFLQLCC